MLKKPTLLLWVLPFFILDSNFSGAFGAEPPDSLTIHGQYEALGTIHWTGGAGDKTLLRRGAFLTNDLDLKIDAPLWEDWNFSSDISLRKTPDPQIDKRKDLRLLGFTAEVFNPIWRFTGGDFFADFSQYTLGQALKGLQAVRRTETTEAKAIFGYSQKPDESSHFLRLVSGGRFESLIHQPLEAIKNWRVGVNFVDHEDIQSSIDNRGGVADASNRVGSVNTSLDLWEKTAVTGELAKAWIDENRSANTDIDRQTGTALRLNANSRFSHKLRTKLGYEWVTAYFNTLGGSAVPDRVNITSRLDYKWNSVWTSEAGYRLSYDKLDKSAENKRTVTQIPRMALNWTPDSSEWLLQNFFSRVYWEMRNRHSQDDPSGQLDFTSNDIGIEDEFKVDRVTFTSGLSLRTESDDLTKINNRTITNGYAGIRMNEKFLGVDAVPSLRYQFLYEDRPKEDGRDLSQSVAAGLNLDFGEGLLFEQRYSVDFSNRLAHDADSVRFNAYLGLNYKIPGTEDVTLTVSYELIQFSHDISTERFAEHNFQTRLLWKF